MARMTIAQLTAENTRLREHCNHIETLLASAQAELAARKAAPRSQPTAKPHATQFGDYWDYVRAARKWCLANAKPVSYSTVEQFNEAHHDVEQFERAGL